MLLNSTHPTELMSEVRKFTNEYQYDPQITRVTTYPQFPYYLSTYFERLGMFFGLCYNLVYIFTFSWLIYGVVSEKEKKIREGMFIMGLNESALFWSWIIVYCIETVFMALVIMIL